MNNVEEILCESIEDKCGLAGLMRFNALYTGGFETADGRPDLAGISAAVNGAFPEDQAAAIVAAVTKKLETGRKSGKKQPAAPAEGQEEPAGIREVLQRRPQPRPGHRQRGAPVEGGHGQIDAVAMGAPLGQGGREPGPGGQSPRRGSPGRRK